MQPTIEGVLGLYEQGRISRRQFIEAASVVAATAAFAPAALAAEPPPKIVPISVNHIALSVSDVKRSVDWYTRLFKLQVIQQNEHYALLQFGNTQLVIRSATPQRPTLVPGTVNHFQFGIAPYDEAALFGTLRAQGFEPKKDLESALIHDPDNLLVQIGDARMGLDTGYPPASE